MKIKRAVTLKEAEKLYTSLCGGIEFTSYMRGIVYCELVMMPAFKAKRLIELLEQSDKKLRDARVLLLKTVYVPSEE